MTDDDIAKLAEIDDLLDRFESLTPAEELRLEELDEWNRSSLEAIGLPIDTLLNALADAEIDEDEWGELLATATPTKSSPSPSSRRTTNGVG